MKLKCIILSLSVLVTACTTTDLKKTECVGIYKTQTFPYQYVKILMHKAKEKNNGEVLYKVKPKLGFRVSGLISDNELESVQCNGD